MHSRLANLIYGAGMTAGALALAWLLNVVFQRSWAAIAMFLLAMLIVILLQRMVAGGIPEERITSERANDHQHGPRPSIRQETAGLAGADLRYGWMAVPPAVAFTAVVISRFL